MDQVQVYNGGIYESFVEAQADGAVRSTPSVISATNAYSTI